MAKKKKKGLSLIDLGARQEFISTLDTDDEKTRWMIGPLSARQLFGVYAKYEGDGEEEVLQSPAQSALMAMDFVKYGLKQVVGPLSSGFTMTSSTDLGFSSKCVKSSYLDRLPTELIVELGGQIATISTLGTEQKKG